MFIKELQKQYKSDIVEAFTGYEHLKHVYLAVDSDGEINLYEDKPKLEVDNDFDEPEAWWYQPDSMLALFSQFLGHVKTEKGNFCLVCVKLNREDYV